MNHFRILIAFVFSLCVQVRAHGQSYLSVLPSVPSSFDLYVGQPGLKFSRVVDTLSKLINPTDTGEDGGLKKLLEFKERWQGVVAQNGTSWENMFEKYYRELAAAGSTPPFCISGPYPARWESIGPDSFPTQQIGYVNAIWASPTDSNYILAGSEYGGLFKSTNGGKNWINITDNSAFSNGWVRIEQIAVNPLNPNTIYLGTSGAGLLKSYDAGLHWQREYVARTGNKDDFQSSKKIFFRPDTLRLYALKNDSVFTCSNDAVSSTHDWINITPTGNPLLCRWRDVVFRPGNLSEFFISNGLGSDKYYQGIYRSTDSMGVYTEITTAANGFPNSTFPSGIIDDTSWAFMKLAMPESDTLYIFAYAMNSKANLYKYSISGNNFIEVYHDLPNATGNHSGKGEFIVSNGATTNNMNRRSIYYGWDVPYHSYNGGLTFNPIGLYDGAPTHGDIRGMFLQQASNSLHGKDDRLFIATDGGVSKKPEGVDDSVSNSGYASIDISGKGLTCGEFNGFYASELGLTIGGTMHNGVAAYEPDKNPKWKNLGGGDSWTTTFEQSKPTKAYAFTGHNGVDLSTTNTVSGVRQMNSLNFSFPNPPDGSGVGPPIGTDMFENIYCGEKHLYEKSAISPSFVNAGFSFPGGVRKSYFIGAVEFSQYDNSFNGYVWYSDTAWIYYRNSSVNFGIALKTSDPPGSATGNRVTALVTDPRNTDRVWVSQLVDTGGAIPNRLVYSDDHGTTWTVVPGGLPTNLPITKMVYDEASNTVYAATDVGVYQGDFSTYDPSVTIWGENHSVTWRCFSQGLVSGKNLPNVRISKLAISHCAGKLYAATYGRSIWSTDIYPKDTVLHPTEIITGITNWGSSTPDIYMSGSIQVKAGGKLTITGNTIHMPSNGVIAVEPGGELKIVNAKITNSCENCFWQGIEARGVVTAPQVPTSNQGRVTIQNNSIIEHARIGVSNTNKAIGWGANGGIIQVSNSFFINNNTSVSFEGYSNVHGGKLYPNLSYFTDCTFLIDSNYKGKNINYPMRNMVSMHAVEGIRFAGCQFLNRCTKPINRGSGEGIHAVNSSFMVYPYCAVGPSVSLGCIYPKRPRFCGFTNGINIENSRDFGLTSSIDQADFDSCSIGEHVFAYPNVSTTRCHFNIGQGRSIDSVTSSSFTGCHQNIGILMHNSSHFRMEENTFHGIPSGYVDWYNYGTVIGNGGGVANKVYRNNYDNLTYGIFSIGNNNYSYDFSALVAYPTGLLIQCNTFNSNNTDITVTSKGTAKTHDAIGFYQSTGWVPQSNSYSGSTTNVKNTTGNRIEFLHDGTAGETPITSMLENTWNVSTTVSLRSCGSSFYNPFSGSVPYTGTASSAVLGAPPMPVPPNPHPDPKSDFYLARSNFQTALTTYNSNIDFGNTSSLITTINASTSASTLYSLLSSGSPFISKQALKATSDLGLLNYVQMRNIMKQNPDNLDDHWFVDYVDADYSFSPADMDTLVAYSFHTTDRTALEMSLSSSHAAMDDAANIIMMALKSTWNPDISVYDTVGTGICTDTTSVFYGLDSNSYYAGLDSVDTWLLKLNSLASSYERAGYYNFKGEQAIADSILVGMNSIVPSALTDSVERSIYDSHMSLWGVVKAAQNDGRDIYHLDTTEIASLGGAVAPELTINTAELMKRAITRMAKREKWADPGPFFPPWGYPMPEILCMGIAEFEGKPGRSTASLSSIDKKGNIDNSGFSVYPNPTSGVVTFIYSLPDRDNDIRIIITNVLGEKVAMLQTGSNTGKLLWDPSVVPSGIYVYQALDGKGLINKGKLVIVR